MKKYYNYHGRIMERIENGELVDIVESKDPQFAMVFVFNTAPYTRPIRPHAVFRYDFLFNKEN